MLAHPPGRWSRGCWWSFWHCSDPDTRWRRPPRSRRSLLSLGRCETAHTHTHTVSQCFSLKFLTCYEHRQHKLWPTPTTVHRKKDQKKVWSKPKTHVWTQTLLCFPTASTSPGGKTTEQTMGWWGWVWVRTGDQTLQTHNSTLTGLFNKALQSHSIRPGSLDYRMGRCSLLPL